MKNVRDLELGFTDAQHYGQGKNKQKLSDIFVKSTYFDQLLNPYIFFLLGEKGTGKTAYATYLSNSEINNHRSIIRFISATDYDKFYKMKKMNKLDMSGYVSVWKVIILLLLGETVTDKDKVKTIYNKSIISDIVSAINDYYANAFKPEIITVLNMLNESKVIAGIISKVVEARLQHDKIVSLSEANFQTSLYSIEKNFSDAIKKLKLKKNITLFIDGIDIRPSTIEYEDYLECIRGLVDAAWNLNTELFQKVPDSKAKLRVVLLLRPDIYGALDVQNSTNKLRDNTVFLDWRTTYNDYQKSQLFKIGVRLLSYQQENIPLNNIWESYFPWKIKTRQENRAHDTAFMAFLRISLSRPRDILVIMTILKDLMVKKGVANKTVFDYHVFQSDEFQNSYSEYFMGTLKDQLAFYYSTVDFQNFIYFFSLFKKKSFDYETYKKNFDIFQEYMLKKPDSLPEFVDDSSKMLQLLYDSNVIAAIEKQENDIPYYHFSYREKSSYSICPSVPVNPNITYTFHYGMYKKNNFGRF
jgi:hypothetical protein